jgi:hypothetical protein
MKKRALNSAGKSSNDEKRRLSSNSRTKFSKLEKNFSRDHLERGIVLRKKLAMSPIRSRKVTRIPSQTIYKNNPIHEAVEDRAV